MSHRSRPLSLLFAACLFFTILGLSACGDDSRTPAQADGDQAETTDDDTEAAEQEAESPWPACGTLAPAAPSLIPGPAQDGYDADLALLAARYDRLYHAFTAWPMGVGTDAVMDIAHTEKRETLRAFLQDTTEWDYAPGPLSLIEGWQKTAGLYAGVGAMADAMRYALLREQGADCAELERARTHLTAALEAVHLAFDIGGVAGVVARGFVRKDLPGAAASTTTTPLFDAGGQALPAEKNNGTWREDNSGRHPDYYWEDSCSRDMLLGWAGAIGLGMEVIENDPAFSDDLKARLRKDAHQTVAGLRVVRAGGYDLELPDADGRTTYHGYLNEHAVERTVYLNSFKNGFYSIMALGILASLATAANDENDWSYIEQELVATRRLHEIARDRMVYIDMADANFSNYNMAFISAFLALRYLRDADTRGVIAEAVKTQLYYGDKGKSLGHGLKMSLYDLVYLYALQGGGKSAPGLSAAPDATALSDALETLKAFATPPSYDYAVTNCDESEVESGTCTLNDGTEVVVKGGRGDSLVCDQPVPKAIRRPSNFEWRSNPHEPNGGGNGSNLFSGDDFRIAYWMGRFLNL